MTVKQVSTQKILHLFGYFILLGIITFLVFQRHQNTGFFNWRSKMWADPVGYYVYLPAFIIYNFDAAEFPEKITEKTGEGFIINEKGKIITRYTCGVALLQAPVFLGVHLIVGLTGQEQDGFSGIYHLVSSLAAILYSFFGLLLLWHFLLYYFNKWITFFSILTVFFGTNLLYYTIDATGMSHVYSFFLFALLLLLSKLFFAENKKQKKTGYFILISLVSSLIVLVRPTNIAFVGLVFLLDTTSWKDLKIRVTQVFTFKNVFIFAISTFLIFLPQLLYWKYSSGSFVTDSYQGYGFTNWESPEIIKFLFSTNNGLFTYNPIYFIILIGLVFMIIKKQKTGIYILGLFVILIYVFSSWFVFSFGCGFGSRNFVEYTTLFALPVGYLYSKFLKRNIFKWLIVIPLVISAVYVNVKLTSAYNKCFMDGDWNWEEYRFLLNSKKYNQSFKFEPPLVLGRTQEFSESLRIRTDKISKVNFRRAIIEVETRIFEKETSAIIVFQISTPDTLLYWNGINMVERIPENELGVIKKIKGDFWLPRHYTIESEMSAFVWNIGLDSLEISKIKFHLE